MRKLAFIATLTFLCVPAFAQRFVKVFDSVSALVAANPFDVHTNAFVSGVTNISIYTWNPSATDPTNANLSVLKPNSVSTGRWFLHTSGGGSGITNFFETIYVTNLTVLTTNFYVTNFVFNTTIITNISQSDNWMDEGASNSTLAGIAKPWKVISTNSVEVGQAGETGVIEFSSTNGTYTIAFSLLSDGTLTVTNNGVLVDTLALNSLYGGSGTKAKMDDGTYKIIASPPGAVVTNININPSDNYYPVRSNSTTFKDGALYSVNTTNVATDARFVWGPGTTNVIYRSGTDLIYTNGSTSGSVLKIMSGGGTATAVNLGHNSGDQPLLSGAGSVFVFSGGGITYSMQGGGFIPTTEFALGGPNVGTFFGDLGGTALYVKGVYTAAGANFEQLKVTATTTTNGTIYNNIANGTGTYRRHTFQIGGTNALTIAPNNGWSGAGTKDFTDDGTFKIRTNYVTVALSNPNTAVTTGNTNFWVAPEAVTIKTVTAHLLVPSSSGSVTLELKKNGTTVLSSPVSLTSGTTNATASVSVTSVSAFDRLAGEITAAGTTAYGAQLKIGYTTP